jgi:type I restriction enzyme S subunit
VKVLPLGEVCTLEYGKPLDKEFRKPDGAFQAYGANGPISSASKYLIDGPCVIVGRKGSAGEITYVKENVWPLDVTYYVKHDPKESDLRYLFYTLQNLDLKQFVRGVKPGLNRNDVYNLPIPLPPLEEQRKIVEKIDKAFTEIALAHSHLGKRRNCYSLLEEAFIDERLSQNRESFISKKLSDITSKIGSGATPRGGEESYKSEGISLIRSLNVYDDGFRDRKLAFIDDVQAKALANVEVKTGDVLLNITGASIARTCIAPQEYLPARVNQHVSIIRPKPEIISSEYLHFLLRSQKMKSSLLGVGNSGGSTRQALTKVDLENTIIEFPPEVENQKKVVDELKLFRDLSQTYMNNLRKLESLYSDLQNSLLISELSGSVI